MYYYFCADIDCVLKVNGERFTLSKNPRLLDVDHLENPLLEVCFLDGKTPNLNYILSDETLLNPPESIAVTDLNGGYLIKFLYVKQKPLQILQQKEYGNIRVTVYYEGTLKISVETDKDFLIEELALSISSVDTACFNLFNHTFISAFFKERGYLIVYCTDDGVKKVFANNCVDFSYGGVLKTSQTFNDILKHTVTSSYTFKNGAFILQDSSVSSKRTYDKTRYREELIPLLFFEELLVGGDICPYVTLSLSENKNKLYEYLGNYISVITPPSFINSNYVGLVYKKKENLFYLRYYKTEMENGLIKNILKV